MKVAVVGKGGSGKTTTSAVLARALARRGLKTIALDCDTNPNLGLSLGVGEVETDRLVAVRQAVDTGEEEHAADFSDLIKRFGVDAPDGVRLAVVSAIENPEPGCPCCGISPEQLLERLDSTDGVVVADFEAGLGTVIRMGSNPIDVIIVVTEPTSKSLEVARRAVTLVQQEKLGRLVIAANRVRDDADLDRIRAALPDLDLVVIPDEPEIVNAERLGESPLDSAPLSPGVRALVGLAENVVQR